MIKLWIDEDGKQKQLVFSGDIGNHDRPILRDPHEFETADVVVMESTYGDHLHPPRADAVKLLAGIIKTTFDKGGNVVIPAFSVGRTQELLYDLSAIMRANMEGLGSFDVYVDSPLSSKATKVFAANFNRGYFDDEAMALKNSGIDPFRFDTLHFVETADESKALNFNTTSKVIISASGMCEAGRIKHHLKHNLFRRECAVVFAGYQAEGTLGRSIVEGAKRVRIFGEEIEVKASVHRLEGFSGHADQAGLLEWIGAFDNKPKVMVTHGEDAVAAGFAQLLIDRGYDARAPREGDAYDLIAGELREAPPAKALPEAKAAVAEQPVEMVGELLGWGGIKARLRQDGERMMQTASLLERFMGGQSRKKRKQYGSLIRIVRNAAKEMIRG
jgi:metallo-beta-lactamase family protein